MLQFALHNFKLIHMEKPSTNQISRRSHGGNDGTYPSYISASTDYLNPLYSPY